jgi:hypothetical protein
MKFKLYGIYLTPEQHQRMVARGLEFKLSVSAVIRRLIEGEMNASDPFASKSRSRPEELPLKSQARDPQCRECAKQHPLKCFRCREE